MYKPRTYRRWVKSDDLVSFEVVEAPTDLLISAPKTLEPQARTAILNCRRDIETYIRRDPSFLTSLEPVRVADDAPAVVRAMADAAQAASVGPMAAVAGAVAEYVGRELLRSADQVIVENGGDIFLKTARKRTMGIYAGERSPFTGKLSIVIEPSETGLGVCTSSGTVSHSLSLGNADAALIIADSAALADAAATAAGNRVKGPGDIDAALASMRSVKGIRGVLILAGNKMGSWGEIELE